MSPESSLGKGGRTRHRVFDARGEPVEVVIGGHVVDTSGAGVLTVTRGSDAAAQLDEALKSREQAFAQLGIQQWTGRYIPSVGPRLHEIAPSGRSGLTGGVHVDERIDVSAVLDRITRVRVPDGGELFGPYGAVLTDILQSGKLLLDDPRRIAILLEGRDLANLRVGQAFLADRLRKAGRRAFGQGNEVHGLNARDMQLLSEQIYFAWVRDNLIAGGDAY